LILRTALEREEK
jgi:hypothetical protein